MEQKSFGVGFYVGVHGHQNTNRRVSDVLREWAHDSAPVIRLYGNDYKIKEFKVHRGFIQGVFAKFRHNNIPRIGSTTDDEETPIELESEEGLIEKNHFLYYPSRQLLVYQQNRDAATQNRLAEYITTATDETTVFNPVLTSDSIRRLLAGGVRPVKLEVSFATPQNTNALGRRRFTNDAMSILSGVQGRRMHLTISLGKRSRNAGDYLTMDVKDALVELTRMTDVSIARMDVENDQGISDSIDLIAERLKDKIVVEMDGRYPRSSAVFEALRDLKNSYNSQLRDCLG